MLSRYSWPVSSMAGASPDGAQRSNRPPVALVPPPRYQLLAERFGVRHADTWIDRCAADPFTSDLKVDEAGLARQIDYVVKDCRASMVVAAGVETQEYTYLGLAERKDLIR